jgi:hypothetical protein
MGIIISNNTLINTYSYIDVGFITDLGKFYSYLLRPLFINSAIAGVLDSSICMHINLEYKEFNVWIFSSLMRE